MKNVPYATLGALVFPGALTFHENESIALIGAAVAFFIAFTGVNIIITVLGSIGVLTILSLIS